MGFAALIVAAGRGTRAGGGLPKQYRTLAGKPVLRRTVEVFLSHPELTHLCVAIHVDDLSLYKTALDGVNDPRILAPAHGGPTRAASVRLGLEALTQTAPDLLIASLPDNVLIHDAARPFVSHQVVDSVLDALTIDPGAVPALPVVDALWRGTDGLAEKSQARDGLWRAQTPQGFHFPAILDAHRAVGENSAADDGEIARAAGLTVALTPGCEDNVKLTRPEDFVRAEARLGGQMDIRTGNGYDVHRFSDDESACVVLCGVEIPHDRSLLGHSDADVAMHAITDAIFGALGEGDIGQWFPPTEARWKGVASHVFLEKAVERIRDRRGRITHIDCTIICEAPKIGPHAGAMRQRIAEIIGTETDRVSIKATTSEGLGFTGRGEGIAAQATATVILT